MGLLILLLILLFIGIHLDEKLLQVLILSFIAVGILGSVTDYFIDKSVKEHETRLKKEQEEQYKIKQEELEQRKFLEFKQRYLEAKKSVDNIEKEIQLGIRKPINLEEVDGEFLNVTNPRLKRFCDKYHITFDELCELNDRYIKTKDI